MTCKTGQVSEKTAKQPGNEGILFRQCADRLAEEQKLHQYPQQSQQCKRTDAQVLEMCIFRNTLPVFCLSLTAEVFLSGAAAVVNYSVLLQLVVTG